MEVHRFLEEDALYVQLRDTEYARGQEVDDARHIDLDINGEVLGIRFLYVTEGVDLDCVPDRESQSVITELEQIGVKIISHSA